MSESRGKRFVEVSSDPPAVISVTSTSASPLEREVANNCAFVAEVTHHEVIYEIDT